MFKDAVSKPRWLLRGCAVIAVIALLLAACGDDDDMGDGDEHDGMAMEDDADDEHDGMAMEDDADDEHDGMAMGDDADDEHDDMAMGDDADDEHEGAHEGTEAGVVQPKPDGAVEVRLIISEWAITPTVTTVEAGMVYFLAINAGPQHPHEVVIIRTDLGPDQLPASADGSVPEDVIEIIGSIAEFESGTQASGLFHLEPGNYLLICNLVEITGNLESHYDSGMRVAFTVE